MYLNALTGFGARVRPAAGGLSSAVLLGSDVDTSPADSTAHVVSVTTPTIGAAIFVVGWGRDINQIAAIDAISADFTTTTWTNVVNETRAIGGERLTISLWRAEVTGGSGTEVTLDFGNNDELAAAIFEVDGAAETPAQYDVVNADQGGTEATITTTLSTAIGAGTFTLGAIFQKAANWQWANAGTGFTELANLSFGQKKATLIINETPTDEDVIFDNVRDDYAIVAFEIEPK